MKLDLRKKKRPNLNSTRSFFFTWIVFGVLFGSPSVYYIISETIIPLNFRSIIIYYLDGYQVILKLVSSIFDPVGRFIVYCFSLLDIEVEYSNRWVPLFVISSLAFLCIIRGIFGITKRYEELPLAFAAYVSCFIGCFVLGFLDWNEGNVFWHALLSLAPFGLLSIPFLVLGSTVMNLYARFQYRRYSAEVSHLVMREADLVEELAKLDRRINAQREDLKQKREKAPDTGWRRKKKLTKAEERALEHYEEAKLALEESKRRYTSVSSLIEVARSSQKQNQRIVGAFESMKNTSNIGSSGAMVAILSVYVFSLVLSLAVINIPILNRNPSVVLIIVQMLLLSILFLYLGIRKNSPEVIHFSLMLQGSILGVFVLSLLDYILPLANHVA